MKKILSIVMIFLFINISTNCSGQPISYDDEKDIFHFLSTGNSDVIIIESNGKFALVDSAEDTGTSRTRLPQSEIDAINGEGYEEMVIEYLENLGVEELEFAIATHAHSDHIGGFDSIFKRFPVGKLYTRQYNETFINDNGEKERLFTVAMEYTWDNQEVYDDMINQALITPKNLSEGTKGTAGETTEIIYVGDDSRADQLEFYLGDFKFHIINNKLYNTPTQRQNRYIPSENSNSLGVVITKNNLKAFLAGDISNDYGQFDEYYLIDDPKTKELLRNVDLFKIAHHGVNGSEDFIRHINPKVTVVTGGQSFNSYGDGYNSLKAINAKNVFTTQDNNHIRVEFLDNKLRYDATIDRFRSDGWQLNDDGYWTYSVGGKLQKGWQEINGSWYFLDSKGIMATGWIKNNNNWYFLNSNGTMATGWIYDNNNWYFLNSNGTMATGWIMDNGTWYYLYSSGEMAKNTTIDGWYLNNSGAGKKL